MGLSIWFSRCTDFLLVTAHITDFLSLSLAQRVCQFPYEGGLVRKDLLLLTVPRHCQGSTGGSPEWWLPCFDMSTQFHLFADFFRQSSIAERCDQWCRSSIHAQQPIQVMILVVVVILVRTCICVSVQLLFLSCCTILLVIVVEVIQSEFTMFVLVGCKYWVDVLRSFQVYRVRSTVGL